MNAVLCLAVIVAAFGSGLAQRPHDPCRTCEIIVNIARHHFNNTVNDKAALLAQLQQECIRLAQFEGQEASAHCTQIVNSKIDQIYDDLHTQKTSRQTCTDIGECPQGFAMPAQKREKRQRPHDPCRTCEIIIAIARHHFNNNITDQSALQAQLLLECQHLAQIEGQAASAHCTQIVNQNIAQIFADMSTNKSPRQTCQDIKECPTMVKREKRQAHNPCRTCEIIIGIAKRHFHNNITDQGALQAQLDLECRNLAQHGFTADEVAHCLSLVDNNMPAIYNELVNNPTASPQKICTDLQQCTAVLKREKRQRPHDPCRTCEIIVNIARHHFNNNITDQNALKAQLLIECQHLAQVEGQAASDHCTQVVNQNIAQIFADMSTHKTARQTCQDIKECPTMIKRQKRQAHNPCRTCEIIIGIAKRHFHNNITDQGALQTQLDLECRNLAQHGFTADEVAHCLSLVDNNMPAIYNELVNNPTANPQKICTDLQQCTAVLKRQKRQRPHDPCRTCEIIVNIARHYFHNNVTDQNALLAQLLLECKNLAQFEGQEASAHCTQVVNQYIAQIFADLSTHKTARQTCQDIKECPPTPSVLPALKREKRQRPHDPCRTCEIIVNIARHHFHNNITDQNALKAQLLIECQHLAQTESQAAADHCVQIVNNNIAKIYADMSTNHTARQTCQDIKECPAKMLFNKRR